MSQGDAGGGPPPPTDRRRSRWLAVLLVVSLAFNLFVVAAVLAHHFGWREGRVKYGRIGAPSLTQLLPRRFFSELDTERRRELVTLMQVHRRDFRRDQRELRLAARTVAEALQAEPFDEARLEQALASFTDRGKALVDMGAGIAREVAGRLTSEERKLLAEHLLKRSESRGRRSSKGKKD